MTGGPVPDEHPSSCPSRLSPQFPCVFIRVLGEKIEARRGTSGSSSRMEVMMSKGNTRSAPKARKLHIRKLITLLAVCILIITSMVSRLWWILNLWYSYQVIGFIVIWIVSNNDVRANVNRFHRFHRFVAPQTFRTFINLDSTYHIYLEFVL